MIRSAGAPDRRSSVTAGTAVPERDELSGPARSGPRPAPEVGDQPDRVRGLLLRPTAGEGRATRARETATALRMSASLCSASLAENRGRAHVRNVR